jgi:hypothetical protein
MSLRERTQQRQGAADCGEYRQAAGIVAQAVTTANGIFNSDLAYHSEQHYGNNS